MHAMKLCSIKPLLLFFFFCLLSQTLPSNAITNPQDVAALQALQQAWSPTSFSWVGDPCDDGWLGVTCDPGSTMVVRLSLTAMGINGFLPPEIGALVNLTYLDLSYNGDLKGTLPTALFLLAELTHLYLQYCGFHGNVPENLGNLSKLQYLALNNNFFTGPIPNNTGQLSQLNWFDISTNQFNGSLPMTLSRLTKAKHFHLNNNNFSGTIPTGIFNSQMSIIHLLLQNNAFTGEIPTDIGALIHLDILRLDSNQFSTIPNSLADLTTVTAVQLNHNNFTSNVPNLSNLTNLQILNLSYNEFVADLVPSWFSSLSNLQSLSMEGGNLQGAVPADIFSPPNLTYVMLGYNKLTDTLDLRMASSSLTEVDLQQNEIAEFQAGNFIGNLTLDLEGNPICQQTTPNLPANSCSSTPASPPTSLPSSCGCSQGLVSNPRASSRNCLCAYPISGVIIFIALKTPLDRKIVPKLESGFANSIPLITTTDQVSISVVSNAVANISIFPNNAEAWSISDANIINALLSSKLITFPSVGPYEYLPFGQYIPPGNAKRSGLSAPAKVGIGIGVAVLAAIILIVGTYAFVQKKRADKAEEISKPFASWMTNGEDNGDAPKVKGARLFTLSEMKKATENFSKSNEIGAGGYGKVYKGVLSSGEQVAIKKAQISSQQGVAEFKNEIELLSRVHHKNLVGLVGFCFEEQMLVYEYMPNGTLRESLSGRTSVQMDWQRRLAVAVGSARGLAYLHTEANPPIIHRDVKSSNILLDEKLVAKVADFGLSKLAPDDDGTGNGHVSTQVKGTLGYLDPEYYTTRRLSEKSDVYSFGVVLLELLTAKQPIERGKFIVREVRGSLETGGLASFQRLLDPKLTDCPAADLNVFLDVALRCVEEAAFTRPTMKEVTKELEVLVCDVENGGKKVNRVYNFSDRESKKDTDSSFHYSGGITVTVDPK